MKIPARGTGPERKADVYVYEDPELARVQQELLSIKGLWGEVARRMRFTFQQISRFAYGEQTQPLYMTVQTFDRVTQEIKREHIEQTMQMIAETYLEDLWNASDNTKWTADQIREFKADDLTWEEWRKLYREITLVTKHQGHKKGRGKR